MFKLETAAYDLGQGRSRVMKQVPLGPNGRVAESVTDSFCEHCTVIETQCRAGKYKSMFPLTSQVKLLSGYYEFFQFSFTFLHYVLLFYLF